MTHLSNIERAQLRASGGLTPRQTECLRLYYEGYNSTEVAKLMGITASTVQGYMKDIRSHFGVGTRVEAIQVALKRGIIGNSPPGEVIVVAAPQLRHETRRPGDAIRCPHCLGRFKIVNGTALKLK
jgi:DNA-binding CsgD family transcriptional regulator